MKCKKLIAGMLCAILLTALCLSNTVFAKETEGFTLRVGYFPDYGMTEGKDGILSGYTYEYMKEIARVNHWGVEFIACDWTEGMELLRQGKLDLFGPMEKTTEREKLYDYPSRSMGEEYGTLYACEDNQSIFYEDIQSLNGKTIGVMSDNYFLKGLSDRCTQNQISIQTVTMNSAKKMDEALSDGSIDLLLAGSMQFPANARAVLRFESQAFFYPTAKGNRFVLEGMNKALDSIQNENVFYNMRLYEKHYAQFAADKKAFTVDEVNFIDHAPVLRVGYESGGMPMEYYDEESQTAKGITIDLMQKISQYSGLQFEFVKTNSMEHAIQLVDSGEIQLVSGLLSCVHFTELYHLEPTKPLMENSLVFIIKQGTDFETSKPVLALPQKWVGIRHHMEVNYPDVRIEDYADMDDCLNALTSGQANLTVQNTLLADQILNERRYRELTANSMRKGDIPICLGIAMDADPILCTIINKSLAAISDDVRNQIVYQHTLGIPYEPSFYEILSYNVPVLLFGIVLFFLVLSLFSMRSRRKLNNLAFRDPLTGEMNLNKFMLETQKVMNRKDKTNALMVIDIDKFKSINDLYGYEFGDQLLILVAKALRKSLFPGSLLCRGAADKFFLFFEFIDKDLVDKQFKLLVKNVESEVAQNMPSCKIILSSGICIIQQQDHNIISIIDCANIASKHVKSYHESCFAFYERSMYDRLNQIRTIENSMADSLKNGEFIVYLQPKIELATNQIAGAEALVRWQHPERGIIQPDDFIPLFEENGFIVNLDFYILEYVCKVLEQWKREGRSLFPVSINLSRRHLFHADTAQQLYSIVSKYDVAPELIEVELTESAFDNFDFPTMNTLFDELHQCGFTVSVDDFGAGYSSLSLLKDLPIDVLKIDKSFFNCRENCKIDKMRILLESIISLSRNLNIKTVSEGVETEQQVDLLIRLGCDLAQGFYFARPMPIEQLETLLTSEDVFTKSKKIDKTHFNQR